MKGNYVWYAAYGSNLSEERFLCYIKGGTPKYSSGAKDHGPMHDPNEPQANQSFIIPYELYFAYKGGGWNDRGVAFIDTNKPGKTIGRLWLITKDQYSQLRDREGRCLYNYPKSLGQHEGMEVYTITSEIRRTDILIPSIGYLATMFEGLAEIQHTISERDFKDYFNHLSGFINP